MNASTSKKSPAEKDLLSNEDRVEREDFVTFINACFACTGQREFYDSEESQSVSIQFLHQYILGNYRNFYGQTIAVGINFFSQGLIIRNLLASGSGLSKSQRSSESKIILRALSRMPISYALRILKSLKKARINNRWTRAIVRDFLTTRKNKTFEMVKYRSKFKDMTVHAHLGWSEEEGRFLFGEFRSHYETPLFETFRKAHFAKGAVYDLPFTIAEGLAAKHDIPRDVFLKKIEPQMTDNEKRRWLNVASKEKVNLNVNFNRLGLTDLMVTAYGLNATSRASQLDGLRNALQEVCARSRPGSMPKLGRIGLVLDTSFSTSGSSVKKRRPLSVAVALSELVQSLGEDVIVRWTAPVDDPLLADPRGTTNLAGPLLEVLREQPDLVVLVSDGYENDPPGGVHEVVRVFKTRLDPGNKVEFLHMNPVFEGDLYAPKSLSPLIPTMGIRNGEDFVTLLNFARFASGTTSSKDMGRYLNACVDKFCEVRS